MGDDKIPSVHAKHRILLLYLRIPFRCCCVVLVLLDGLRQQQQYSEGIIKMSLGMVMLTLSTKKTASAEEDNGRTAEISLYLRLLAISIAKTLMGRGHGPVVISVICTVRAWTLKGIPGGKWKWIGAQKYFQYYVPPPPITY